MWFQNLFELSVSVRVGEDKICYDICWSPEYCSSLERRKRLSLATFLIHVIPTKGLAHWVLQMKRTTFSTVQWVIMKTVTFDVEENKIKTFPIF